MHSHQSIYNRKNASCYTFLLKIYQHQSFNNIVHFQNCYCSRVYLHDYCSFLYEFFIFFLSLLSSNSLSSSTLFLLLSSLKSNNKSIQIIKFFKLILNLYHKFIKPSLKKNHQAHIDNPIQIAKEEENAKVVEEEKAAVESLKSWPTVVEKSVQNHHPNCKHKIIAHNQTQIAKEKEEERRGCQRRRRCRRRKNEKEKKKEERKGKIERKRECLEK